MKIDITLPLTVKIVREAQSNEKKALEGHLGTHFDVMNQVFPLDYTERVGLIFDVKGIYEREIEVTDIDLARVQEGMFVVFATGFIDEVPYGSGKYFSEHPTLSNELIDALLEKGVSVIGVDFAGVRRGKEHSPKDAYCAMRGTFIIENLCNLSALLAHGDTFHAHIYPMNYVGTTGLPCRVIGDV